MDPTASATGAQAQRAPRRPPIEPVDQDLSRRPGYPRERPPEPWPNARPVPARMTAEPAVPKHGRAHKPFPPVYGTALPPRGLSGAIRRAAYRLPDHYANHWTLLLLADRVESWSLRARRTLAVAAPLAVGAVVLRRVLRDR